MREKRKVSVVLVPLLAVIILVGFLSAVANLETGQRTEGRKQLEETLRQTAVACYAAEGAYPPDLAYMQEHYGIQVDEKRYTVVYEVIASNLMPDITVLEVMP